MKYVIMLVDDDVPGILEAAGLGEKVAKHDSVGGMIPTPKGCVWWLSERLPPSPIVGDVKSGYGEFESLHSAIDHLRWNREAEWKRQEKELEKAKKEGKAKKR